MYQPRARRNAGASSRVNTLALDGAAISWQVLKFLAFWRHLRAGDRADNATREEISTVVEYDEARAGAPREAHAVPAGVRECSILLRDVPHNCHPLV